MCHYVTRFVKTKLKTDDTVDVFACHGIGGLMGSLLTAVFSTTAINSAGADGLLYGGTKLFVANLVGSCAVIAFTMVMTYFVFKCVSYIMPIRVSEDVEKSGMDANQHGERAFTLR